MKSQTKQKYIMNHCWIFSISFLTTKTFYSKTQLNIQIKQKHFNRQTIFNRINEKKNVSEPFQPDHRRVMRPFPVNGTF